MTKLTLAILLSLLAATDPSSAQSLNIGDAEYELLSFVQSRLAPQKREKLDWKPEDVSLMRRDKWIWTEIENDFGLLVSSGTRTVYTVDPRELSVPVRADGRDVLLECRLAKCIKVEGITRSSVLLQSPRGGSERSETVVKNWWYFGSTEEAERVAKALTQALTKLGAKPRF